MDHIRISGTEISRRKRVVQHPWEMLHHKSRSACGEIIQVPNSKNYMQLNFMKNVFSLVKMLNYYACHICKDHFSDKKTQNTPKMH